jgi:ketosteroid isomerase-like protein
MTSPEVAIAKLLSDYCWYVDRLEVDAVLDLFSGDAVFDLGQGRVYDGRAGLRDLYRRLDVYAATSHHITNPRIDVRGDEATARSGIHAHHVRHDGSTMTLWGVYLDELARVDGSWVITRRALRASAETGGRPEGGAATQFEVLPRHAG